MSRGLQTVPVEPGSRLAEAGARVLRVVGNDDLLRSRGVGVCGARETTDDGLQLADEVGAACAETGVTLVSGDARGVDSMAQTSALKHGGKVVAVLAEGFAQWRPRAAYRSLLDPDFANFCAISQFDDMHRWQVYRAMARNKAVVALSEALVVIESRITGGTHDAALTALLTGKPVWILGRRWDSLTDGGRDLLRRGGQFVDPVKLASVMSEIPDGRSLVGEQQRLAI